MARTVFDNGIKLVPDQLARDEVDHLKTFVLRYTGDEFDLLALVNSQSARDHPNILVATARDGHCAKEMPWKSLFQRNSIVSKVILHRPLHQGTGITSPFRARPENSLRYYTEINEAYVYFNETPRFVRLAQQQM